MKRTAFTLVEILIVVIILGILAAIVIPQFTQASNDARDSALYSDLHTIRSQLEFYKIQHGDEYPPMDTFVDALTNKTNMDHEIGTDAEHCYGPYLPEFPRNPYVADKDNARKVGEPDAEGVGWYFDVDEQRFYAATPDRAQEW